MKYIVYETTNLVNGKIYIGVHKTVNPDIFDGYIGCGVLVTQPNTYKNPKTHFQYAVKKYGPKNFLRKTLAIFDTLEEASNLERELVNEEYLSRDDVYNMILGGIDDNFYIVVPCYQYDLEGNFIKEYKSIQEASIENNCHHSLIGHAITLKVKGKGFFWTNVKYEKLDISSYNLGLNHQIPIYIYSKEGKLLQEFPNQLQASKALNICSSTIKEYRIFRLLYKDMYYFCEVKDDNYAKARLRYVESRTICKYDGKTGEFIQKYDTQLEAESDNFGSNISKALKQKSVCENGFLWSLEQLPKYASKHKKEKRKVGKYDLEGNLIKIYDSATAAEKENGTSVWKVLKGTNKTQKGHVYKYLN